MAASEQDPVHKSPKHAWARRALIMLLLLGGYRLLVWGLVHSIDLQRLSSEMEDWAHGKLYTDVTIHEMQVNLGLLGFGEVTASNLEIANPDMVSFAGNLLFAKRVRTGCPIWGLWGFRVKPHGVITGARLVLNWNERGQTNLKGLGKPLDTSLKRVAFPFGRINARTFFFDLRDSRLSIQRARQQLRLACGMSGNIVYDIRKRKAWGSLAAKAISHTVANKPMSIKNATVKLRSFSCKFPVQADQLPRLLIAEADFTALPVSALRALWPRLPAILPPIIISGSAHWKRPVLALRGTARGHGLAALGIPGAYGFRAQYTQVEPGLPWPPFSLTINATGGSVQLLSAKVTSNIADNSRTLRLSCKRLCLGALPPSMAGIPNWLQSLVKGFSRIEIKTRAIRLEGLPGLVSGLALGGEMNGVIIRHTPQPGEKDTTQPRWSITLKISNLALQTNSSGKIIRELALTPMAAAYLRAFSQKSLALGPGKTTQPVKPIQLLRFTRLDINYQVFSDGVINIIIDGKSPDLGRVTGGGKLKRDGSKQQVTGNAFVCLRQVPDNLYPASGKLSAVVRAIRKQAQSAQGMRIDIAFSDHGASINRRYLQDAFMILTKIIGEKNK